MAQEIRDKSEAGRDGLDPRVDKIYQLIIKLASGNYHHRGEIEGKMDELDAIITGINMLAEELESTTISRNHLNNI